MSYHFPISVKERPATLASGASTISSQVAVCGYRRHGDDMLDLTHGRHRERGLCDCVSNSITWQDALASLPSQMDCSPYAADLA